MPDFRDSIQDRQEQHERNGAAEDARRAAEAHHGVMDGEAQDTGPTDAEIGLAEMPGRIERAKARLAGCEEGGDAHQLAGWELDGELRTEAELRSIAERSGLLAALVRAYRREVNPADDWTQTAMTKEDFDDATKEYQAAKAWLTANDQAER